MNQMLRSAAVIARRDYTATVWSKTFILFLLGPFFMLGFGGLFGYLGGQADEQALRPTVVMIGAPADTAPVQAAYDRLVKRIGTRLPDMQFEVPSGAIDKQASGFLSRGRNSASLVVAGWPDAPRLIGPSRQIESLENDVSLVLEEVTTSQAFNKAGIKRPETKLIHSVTDPAAGGSSASRHVVARGAQTLLFVLTVMLAGMLLSNLVEEKSNKVIEVLAAAVPIDSIFLGKLVAMLGVSLTGITVWGSVIMLALSKLLPAGVPIPQPAVGWPAFVLLGVAYYIASFMLLGAAFLGIGAQANSVREVQTLSMPATMAQLAVFALASATVNDVSGPLATFAAAFPLSSPLAMIARAAQEPGIVPHLLVLVWQAIWVAIIIRISANRFRRTVLKSGAAGGTTKRAWAFGRR
jgi:ABC-2 type transport system permease protein